MELSCFITKTRPKRRGDTFDQCYQSAEEVFDEVVVVDGQKTWPKEFTWPLIGEHFQKGYERATGDWVFHVDADFIFHEQDKYEIRQACIDNANAPALSFYKYQFILPDRYTLKSRLVIAVNKKKYGNRIKFNSGRDLCQPSLDGKELKPEDVPEAKLPFWNYEKILKTKRQIAEDSGRMERAYKRHFGVYQMGSDGTDESAYHAWVRMTVGRFNARAHEHILLSDHPGTMQDTIKNLKPDQWGYNGHGNLEVNDYAK